MSQRKELNDMLKAQEELLDGADKLKKVLDANPELFSIYKDSSDGDNGGSGSNKKADDKLKILLQDALLQVSLMKEDDDDGNKKRKASTEVSTSDDEGDQSIKIKKLERDNAYMKKAMTSLVVLVQGLIQGQEKDDWMKAGEYEGIRLMRHDVPQDNASRFNTFASGTLRIEKDTHSNQHRILMGDEFKVNMLLVRDIYFDGMNNMGDDRGFEKFNISCVDTPQAQKVHKQLQDAIIVPQAGNNCSRCGSMMIPSSSSSAAVSDPRPINDKNYQNKCIEEIVAYLQENGYEYPVVLSESLIRPSSKDFTNIMTFMLRQIDRDFQRGGTMKFEDEVASKFRSLGYPFNISKTAMVGVGTLHTWPTLLAELHWLMHQITEEFRY